MNLTLTLDSKVSVAQKKRPARSPQTARGADVPPATHPHATGRQSLPRAYRRTVSLRRDGRETLPVASIAVTETR